jgi:hypothetical protein
MRLLSVEERDSKAAAMRKSCAARTIQRYYRSYAKNTPSIRIPINAEHLTDPARAERQNDSAFIPITNQISV